MLLDGKKVSIEELMERLQLEGKESLSIKPESENEEVDENERSDDTLDVLEAIDETYCELTEKIYDYINVKKLDDDDIDEIDELFDKIYTWGKAYACVCINDDLDLAEDMYTVCADCGDVHLTSKEDCECDDEDDVKGTYSVCDKDSKEDYELDDDICFRPFVDKDTKEVLGVTMVKYCDECGEEKVEDIFTNGTLKMEQMAKEMGYRD